MQGWSIRLLVGRVVVDVRCERKRKREASRRRRYSPPRKWEAVSSHRHPSHLPCADIVGVDDVEEQLVRKQQQGGCYAPAGATKAEEQCTESDLHIPEKGSRGVNHAASSIFVDTCYVPRFI